MALTWRSLHIPRGLTPLPCPGVGRGRKGWMSSGWVHASVDKLEASVTRNLRLSSKLSIDLSIKILMYLSMFQQTPGTSQTGKIDTNSPLKISVCFTLEESHFNDSL